MNQLVERMLPICPRLTPDYRPCLIVYALPIAVDILSIAFHIALLEVCRKAMQVLIIRQYCMTFCLEKVVVPDTQQAHDNRNVFFKRTAFEMFISLMRPLKQSLKIIISNRQGNGKSNSRPKRISSTYPIPKLKHIARVDTELRNTFLIGAEWRKVLGNILLRSAIA